MESFLYFQYKASPHPPPLFFFPFRSNAVPDFGSVGRSVGLKKRKTLKNSQVVSESEAWYLSIIAVEPGKQQDVNQKLTWRKSGKKDQQPKFLCDIKNGLTPSLLYGGGIFHSPGTDAAPQFLRQLTLSSHTELVDHHKRLISR